MNSLSLNLAYRFVAIAMMIAHANLFSDRLGLPLDRPINEADVRDGSHVGPPSPGNFSGSIFTDRYSFGFGRGHLANFAKRGFSSNSDAEVKARNIELAKQPCLIDTNGASQLATNWLAQLGVDVGALREKYHLSIIQWRYYPAVKTTEGQLRSLEREPVMLPIFQVEWRGNLKIRNREFPDRVIMSMTISGANKELLEYHLLDDSLMLNPPIEIKEPEKLLSIPDDDFKKLSTAQRNHLVSQFAPSPNDFREPSTGKSGKEALRSE